MNNFLSFFRGKKKVASPRRASFTPGIQVLEDRSVPTIINFTGPTNINPTGSSNPDDYTQVNATLYFTANDTDTTRGVYRYNSNLTPTRIITGTGQPALINPVGMTSAGDRLFFGAQNASDLSQGLYAVISPNNTTMRVLDTPASITGQEIAFGQNTYYLGSATVGGNNGLYRTIDTYNAGVLTSIRSVVVPSNTNPNAVWNNPQKLLIDGPNLYMVDQNAQGAFAIYKITLSSDQSEQYAEFGVKMITTGYNYSSIQDLNLVNGSLYFQGTILGAAKPQLVVNRQGQDFGTLLTQPMDGTDPNLLKVDLVGPTRFVNNQAFFAGNGANQGTQLYTSNGTVAGTKFALEINPITNGLDPVNGLLNAVAVPNALILAANGGLLQTSGGSGPAAFTPYGMEPATIPVALDGSLNAKTPIVFIDMNSGPNGSNPTSFIANNYQVYFSATDPVLGTELFTTQGAAANTFQLKDFNPTGSSNPKNMAVRDGVLYLSADNGTTGSELFVGTTFETRTTSEISSNSPTAKSLVNVNGNLFYMVASDLFVTDGTAGGTRAVTTSSGAAGVLVDSMRNFNGALYFLRTNASNTVELWYSRASTTTPIQQVPLSTPTTFSSSAQVVAVTDNYLYIADNKNLYQVDTTGKITLKFDKFVTSNPTSASVAGRSLTNANGTLFFAGLETTGNYALYRLAPSDAAAMKIADFTFQTGHSQPINFGSIYGRAFFTAVDDFNGNTLYYTEGVPLNTKLSQDTVKVRSLDASTSLDTYSNHIFFGSPTDPAVGNEPWLTDGLLAGTKVFKNINTNNNGTAPSNPSAVVSNGRFALFSAADELTSTGGLTGFEPYIITGFDKPTVTMLKDINPTGPNGSQPGDFLAVGTQMFFTADIGQGGLTNRVLYGTQGTAATTNRVTAANGTTPNNVDNLVNMQGNVAFRAISTTVGSPVVWNSVVDPLALPVKSIQRLNPGSIRVDAPPTTQVVFKVTFNFDVDPASVDINDFVTVYDSTLTKPTISKVTQETPTDLRSYLVTVTVAQNVNSFGKLTINTNPKAVVKAVAIGNPQVDLGLPVKNPEAYEINPKAPTVLSINRFNPPGESASGGTVTYQVNFSQDIIASTVNATDFSVTTTNSVTVPNPFIGTITPVTNNPRSFLVQVIGIQGQGTIRLNVVPNATILSTAGIPYAQGGFTGGQFYTIDTLAPSMSQVLQQNPLSGSSPINNQVVTFQAVFSEPINPTTVDSADFVGTMFGSSVVSTTMINSTNWLVSIAVPNAAGSLGLALSTTANIQDLAGNKISIPANPSPNQVYNVNRVAPVITSINRSSPPNQSTDASQVTFQVAFSTAMDPSTVVASAFQLNTTGTVSGTILSAVPVSGSTSLFLVTVGKFGGSGNVNLYVNPNSGMKDAAGNQMFEGFDSSNPNNQVYTILDNTPPSYVGMTVVPNSDPSVTFVDIAFSESVTGLTNAAFSAVTNTGKILTAVLNPTPQPGTYQPTYRINVSGYQGAGSFTLSFTNTGGIEDLSNLPLNAPVGVVVGTLAVNFAVQGVKPIVATAGIPGTSSVVQITYPNGTTNTLVAFGNFMGGVRATTGDINGDGVEDIIVAAQQGGRSNIRVFDGTTLAPIKNFFPYDGYNGGVSIASADLNNDGVADIICGVTSAFPNQAAGVPPHVVAFNGKTGAVLASYYAYAVNFTGGINVAGGDTNGDGFADIITTPSFGGPAHVKVVSGKNLQVLQSFYAIDPRYLGGAFITAGDFNNDGFADIAVGTNLGIPFISVRSGKDPKVILDNFYPLNPQQQTGARVGTMINGAGETKLIVMPGYNSVPLVQILTYSVQGFYVNSQFVAGFNSLNQGGIPG